MLVLHKPAGLLVQKDSTGDASLFDLARDYLKITFNKPGNVYIGLVHRIDRPASGVVVFARTSKAAGRLSDQFRRKAVKKKYWALVEGQPDDQGRLVNWIRRDGVHSLIATESTGKKSVLSYRVIAYFDGRSLLEVDLETGRHHQIRVQLAHIGFPIIGDFRYGSKRPFPNRAIALHACSVTIKHPVKTDMLTFTAPVDDTWPADVRNIK